MLHPRWYFLFGNTYKSLGKGEQKVPQLSTLRALCWVPFVHLCLVKIPIWHWWWVCVRDLWWTCVLIVFFIIILTIGLLIATEETEKLGMLGDGLKYYRFQTLSRCGIILSRPILSLDDSSTRLCKFHPHLSTRCDDNAHRPSRPFIDQAFANGLVIITVNINIINRLNSSENCYNYVLRTDIPPAGLELDWQQVFIKISWQNG